MGSDDEETALLSNPLSPAHNRSHTESNNGKARSIATSSYSARRRLAEQSQSSSASSHGHFFSSRYLVVLLLAIMVGMGVYFQVEMMDLTTQLSEEKYHAAKMDELLKTHERVIERFNASVTNTDVISRLATLEHDLKTTTDRVEDELSRTEKVISKQLDETVNQLSDTVAEAKKEIEDEVDKVKADVEQYVLITQDQFSMENSFMVYQLAGTFTLLSCLISMWHMTAHLRKMNEPDVQRKILAILWMSPIYAVTSWFSLVFHSAEGWLAIIKDGYEAYVIYQFLAFCIAVIGKGDRNTVVDHLSRHAEHLTPPFRIFGCFEICGCCIPDPYESSRALADAILLQCQVFALQFVLFRPLTTIGVVVCDRLEYYGAGDGPTDYRSPQFWLTVVQNLSIFTAFAGLLKFYHAVDSELAWCRPFAKFLCIKGVVFMTFWQGLAISTVATMTDAGDSEWAKSAQNFLICMEMLAFSIAHFYCFPTDEWQEGYRVKQSHGAFGDSIALNDFFSDVKLILTSNESKKPKTKKGKKLSSHEVIPEGDEEQDEPDNSNVHHFAGSGSQDSRDDETVAASVSTIDENPQLDIARALERSLGAAGEDPDIIEAKERLLASNILRAEFFEDLDENDFNESFWREPEPENSDSADEERTPTGNGETDRESTVKDEDFFPSDDVPSSDSRSGFSSVETEEDEQLPLQRRELYTTEHETLRPSIFTTVASIAESERQAAECEARKSQHDKRKER
jgi:hypothetical protein